jgi:hypothetical protein
MYESTQADDLTTIKARTCALADFPGALPFLLQPDPEALLEVTLVDRPVALPTSQFEALLVDSECEV